MKTDDHKCIVELNSTEITCAIAKINNDKSITIISHSKVESKGIHNGTIVNSLEVTKALRTCLSIAEEKAGIVLKKVNLIVETTELSCTRLSKYRKIGGSKIHKDDIVFLLKEAKKEINLNDNKSSIIHIFNHNYVVDGKEFIKEPIDIYADQLSHEMTFITMSKNAIKNFNEIFINCDLEIERIISKNFALAVNCLNNTDLHLGATLINMELDKTSIGVFKSFALINYVVFPIGINHIAKDISRLCSVTINEASEIRDEIGCSFWNNKNTKNAQNNLEKKFFKETKYRKITVSLLTDIITARIEDILKISKKEIYLTGLSLTSGKNIILVGNGSKLPCLSEFFSNFFKTNIKLIQKTETSSTKPSSEYQIPDSSNGALNIIFNGWETEAIAKTVDNTYKRRGILSKIIQNWA